MDRRPPLGMDRLSRTFVAGMSVVVPWICCLTGSGVAAAERPNILVAISDDQSFPHASAYGDPVVQTPAFDRVASAGVLFRNAFSPAPGCSPMRAALLTGRNIWQLAEAGTHASLFPRRFEVYQDRLEQVGYAVGFTGKGWAPGNWRDSGRSRNPAGPEYAARKLDAPAGISGTDYAANFADFLAQRAPGQPFSFWYGAREAHRGFAAGIGQRAGLDPAGVAVPPFLPDHPVVRNDLADYLYEIRWFDAHLGRMLDHLDELGELDNTLIIVTSDNGMAFPRAKANLYEYGIHMPLAVCWPARVPAGRTVDDLVNLIDVTATIYAASGATPPAAHPLAGRSLVSLLESTQEGQVELSRQEIFAGRERHSSSRYQSLGYPQRCLRTPDYLYIRNFRPERWPAGAPQKYGHGSYPSEDEVRARQLGPPHAGYHDIDACPTLELLVDQRHDPQIGRFLQLAVARRPPEELYDIRRDPGCLTNLAEDPAHRAAKQRLSRRLQAYLEETGDARVTAADGGDVWETYPRYSPLRWFPEPPWALEDPQRVPRPAWLEARRPGAE